MVFKRPLCLVVVIYIVSICYIYVIPHQKRSKIGLFHVF